MDANNFQNVLWRSKCNAGKLPLAIGFLSIAFLLCIFLSMHFLGFGAVVIVFIVLFLADIIFTIAYSAKHRWHNPQLIFILTEEGVISTMKNNPSYFFNEYENIADYSFIKHNEKYTTVTLNFRHATDAGSFRQINSLTMAKIENFESVQKILETKGIPYVQNPTIRTQFNRSK